MAYNYDNIHVEIFILMIFCYISETISMDDYYLKSAEFRTWLSKEVH